MRVIKLSGLGLSLCYLASDRELGFGLIPFESSTYNVGPHSGRKMFLQRPRGSLVLAAVFGSRNSSQYWMVSSVPSVVLALQWEVGAHLQKGL